MKRGYAAKLAKAKIPIPATSCGVFRNFCHSPEGCGTALSFK
jgi:hypothetical protein